MASFVGLEPNSVYIAILKTIVKCLLQNIRQINWKGIYYEKDAFQNVFAGAITCDCCKFHILQGKGY